jgi:hypothetical protein
MVVEELEPRFLLSANGLWGADTANGLPVPPLRVIDVGSADASHDAAAGSDSGIAAASRSMSTPVVPIAGQGGSSAPAIAAGRIDGSDSSTTYRMPVGTEPYLVTFRVTSPAAQATWSLVVRDGDGQELGMVTVPPGQRAVKVEIVGSDGGGGEPLTLTVAADPNQPGQAPGTYVLQVAAQTEAAVLASSASSSTDDDLSSLYLGPYTDQEGPTESGSAPHPHAAVGQAAPAANTGHLALPSGTASGDSTTPRSVPKQFTRSDAPGSPPTEEPGDVAESDTERSARGESVVQTEPVDPAAAARQLVDAPGGLPVAGLGPMPHPAAARRLAEKARLRHPGAESGPVVVSASLAAGLIVPNVLILGSPRIRRARPIWRWRWDAQRRSSAG